MPVLKRRHKRVQLMIFPVGKPVSADVKSVDKRQLWDRHVAAVELANEVNFKFSVMRYKDVAVFRPRKKLLPYDHWFWPTEYIVLANTMDCECFRGIVKPGSASISKVSRIAPSSVNFAAPISIIP